MRQGKPLARTARAAARTSSASLRSFTSSRRRFAVTEYSYTRQGSLEADARWRPSAGERAETSSVGFAAMPDRTARDRIGSHLWLRCGVPLRRRAAGADQTSCSGTSFIRRPSGASSWSACGTCAARAVDSLPCLLAPQLCQPNRWQPSSRAAVRPTTKRTHGRQGGAEAASAVRR